MSVPRRRLAALVAAGLLAAPAPALGQSAGDEQYEDPFAPEEQPQSNPDEPVSSDESPAPVAQEEPAPATSGQEPAPAEAQTGGGAGGSGQPELARTGADAGVVLLAGSILLAGGVALRVRVRA